MHTKKPSLRRRCSTRKPNSVHPKMKLSFCPWVPPPAGFSAITFKPKPAHNMIRLPTKAPKVFFGYDVRRDRTAARRVMERWRFKAGQALDLKDCLRAGPLRILATGMVQRRIDAKLRQSTATVIIIGTQTSTSTAVRFTIRRTHQLEKGMLGIYIGSHPSKGIQDEPRDPNPFERFWITREGHRINLAQIYPAYDWIADGGRFKLVEWIKAAAPSAF